MRSATGPGVRFRHYQSIIAGIACPQPRKTREVVDENSFGAVLLLFFLVAFSLVSTGLFAQH